MDCAFSVFSAENGAGVVETPNRRRARLRGLSGQVKHRSADLHIRSAQRSVDHAPAESFRRGPGVVIDNSKYGGCQVGKLMAAGRVVPSYQLSRGPSETNKLVQQRPFAAKPDQQMGGAELCAGSNHDRNWYRLARRRIY